MGPPARRGAPTLPSSRINGLRLRPPRTLRSARGAGEAAATTPFFVPDQAFESGFMAKRTDISSILVIGAGPIVIGQACEFDYSGTQACKALKEEGYRIVLVNSNPATIMTDPDVADATYVEPITPEIVARIIEKGRHGHSRTALRFCPPMGGHDRAQLRAVAAPHGCAGKIWRHHDRRHRRARSGQGGGPRAVPRGNAADRARDAEVSLSPMLRSDLKKADRDLYQSGIDKVRASGLAAEAERHAIEAYDGAWAAGTKP